jgi:GTP cyclohydrolase I
LNSVASPSNMEQSAQEQQQISVNDQIEGHVREILKLLSITNAEVLEETPRRFRKLMQDRTSSNRQDIDQKVLKTFEMENPGIVIVKDVEVNSICEHHLMPFFGTASIGYLPKKEVLGLSKVARIVNYCSKKENLQERLTDEIMKTIDKAVPNDGIVVLVKCKHFCMILNDEVKSKGETITIVKTGKFKEDYQLFKEFQDSLKL